MKRNLLMLLFVLFLLEAKADLILGMDKKGDTIALAYKKKIILVSIQSGKTIYELDIKADTAVVNSLNRYIFDHTNSKHVGLSANVNVPKIDILNLTFHRQELWVGFKYFDVFSNSTFGVLKLDSSMQFKGFCMMTDQGYIMPPYFPLEIKDGFIMATVLDSNAIKLKKYKLNLATYTAEVHSFNGGKIYSVKQKEFQADSLRLLYSIKGLNYKSYFVFPTPILYHLNQVLYLNSCCVNFNMSQLYPKPFGDGTYLSFDRQINRDNFVMLSTANWNDSLFFLYTFNDTNRVTLEYFDAIKNQYTYRDFRIKSKDTYFILDKWFIYAVQIKSGKVVINKHRIYI